VNIYLIRHGEWHERLSRLSPEGEKQASRAAKILAARGVASENSRLFTSPAKRAVATAEAIAREARLSTPEMAGWLAEGTGFYELVFAGILALRKSGERRHLVLVGHAPQFEVYLNAFKRRDRKEMILLGNGDVYEVEIDTETQRVAKLDE